MEGYYIVGPGMGTQRSSFRVPRKCALVTRPRCGFSCDGEELWSRQGHSELGSRPRRRLHRCWGRSFAFHTSESPIRSKEYGHTIPAVTADQNGSLRYSSFGVKLSVLRPYTVGTSVFASQPFTTRHSRPRYRRCAAVAQNVFSDKCRALHDGQ